MIERKVYQCEHCKKYRRTPRIYFKRDDMYKHEYNCFYNLKNRTCLTCEHNLHERYRSENCCELGVNKGEALGINRIMKHCEKWEEKEGTRNARD